MILGENNKRPDIEYPCEWDYKIIGDSVDGILSAIEIATNGLDYNVTPSNVSKNGKYFSVNLKVKVESEEIRNSVYSALDGHTSVIMIL